jgi:hypothetical protein
MSEHCEGVSPSETKEETTNSRLRTMDVGALAILESFAPPIGIAG